MKTIRIVLALISLLAVTSCSTTIVTTKTAKSNSKRVPPGQMKKITGSKSAAPYAPGQQKKSAVKKK